MRRRSLLLWATLLVVATGRLFAQAGATGTILGTVTDSSGALLPEVRITVTNTETGVAFRTVTSSAGDYDAPSLNPGTYSVSAEAPGFEKSKTNAFTLQVDQKVRIDLSMKPGAVTVTEEVNVPAGILTTTGPWLGENVTTPPLPLTVWIAAWRGKVTSFRAASRMAVATASPLIAEIST